MFSEAYTSRATKIHLFAFLFLFLFSNLLSRMTGLNINIVFYLVFLSILLPSLTVARGNLTTLLYFLMLFVCLGYVFFDTSGLKETGFVVKDFIVPMLTFLIGAYLYIHRTAATNLINVLYLPFVLYGLVQLASIHLGWFERLLPWDFEYVQQYYENFWTSTLARGSMLRPFGIMNSFVEYQVSLVVLIFLIALNKEVVTNRRLYWVNVACALLFLVLSLERSPIAMFVIILGVWQHRILLGGLKRTVKFAVFLFVLISALVVFDQTASPEENPVYGQQYRMLKNLVTFDLDEDLAMVARRELAWSESIDLGFKHLWGIGVARVSPSLCRYDMVGPHNGFLGHYLAFGLLGLLTFLFFLMVCAAQFAKYDYNYKYFGFGCLAAFSAMAMFNMPFIAKLGVVFFMMMGFLCYHRPAEE
jgi:hypothetical protein